MVAARLTEQEREARLLAEENRNGDVTIERALWFPNQAGEEIHLVLVSKQSPSDEDDFLHPLYFDPAPEHGLCRSSAVAIIQPSDVGKLRLPEGWSDWTAAKEV